MTYQLYGYAPEPEPVEIFHDFEEAAVRCEELVHEDGYDSGEVWDTEGDLVYRVGRRPATLARPEPDVIMAPRPTPRRSGAAAVCEDEPRASRTVERTVARAPARVRDAERAIRVVRDDDRRRAAASERRASLAAAQAMQAVPPPSAPASSVWVLGDRTGAPTLWFGDSE